MSKIETLNRLAREQSQPALQIVESVQTLQRSIEQLQSMPQQLEQLPDAIAAIMGPMTASTEAMAERVDKLASTQREAIQQFVAQMQGEMRQTIKTPVDAINRDLQTLRESMRSLTGAMSDVETVSKKLQRQSDELRSAQTAMMQTAQELQRHAQRARGNPFMRLIGLLTVGIVSAAATLTGVHVLGPRLDDTARAAAQMRHIMTVATDAEVELLRQIVRRPAR